MYSLYDHVVGKILKSAVRPIIVIELLLIVSLFALGLFHESRNHAMTKASTAATFREFAMEVSKRLDGIFEQMKREVTTIKTVAEALLIDQTVRGGEPERFVYDEGFFIRQNRALSSVYTTNLNRLDADDVRWLRSLSLAELPIDAVLRQYPGMIDSAWINIGSKYSLYYPPIVVQDELSPNLDATRHSYYYEADAEHNPQRRAKFIALFNEPWALDLGQIGAVTAPIYISEAMVGVVGMALTTENFRSIGTVPLPHNAYVIIGDKAGHVLYSSNERRMQVDFNVTSFYALHHGHNSGELRPLKCEENASSPFLFYEHAFGNTGLKVIVVADKREINREVEAVFRNTQLLAAVLLGAVLLFHLLFLYYLRRKTRRLTATIAEPIVQIAHASTRLFDEAPLSLDSSGIEELSLLGENLQKAHGQLIDQLYIDEVTGLPNRRKLLLDIRSDSVVMLLSMDNFAMIGRLYGPEAASALVNQVSASIAASVPWSGLLYRVHYEVFAMHMNDAECTYEALMNFYGTFSLQSFRLNDVSVALSISIAYADQQSCAELTLLDKAEIALEDARNNGVRKCVFFDSSLHSAKIFEENLSWAKRLQASINEERLIPYFQPIYDIQNGEVLKFESLVRMQESDVVISPFFFLGAAKRLGKLADITRIMTEKVFAVARQHSDLSFSINVSFDDFEQADMLLTIERLLLEHRINAGNIIFEILETGTFSDEARATDIIRRLKTLGFKIAIDDFGSGNSNFAHLMMMNVDFIKIDGQFIKEIATDERSLNITRTISEFARLTHAKTIAEFVKDEATYDAVKALGIDYAQGYFISKPKPAEAIAAMRKLQC